MNDFLKASKETRKVNSFRRIASRTVRRASLGLAPLAIAIGLAAPSAIAAPSLEVELTRDEAQFPTVSRSDERVDYTVKVKNTGADPTAGTVNVELELPAGGTFVFDTNPTSWSCDKVPPAGIEPATAACSRSDVLAAGTEYEVLTVVAALGDDLPAIAGAKATAFGGGAPVPASDDLAFPVGPAVPFGMEKFTAQLLASDGVSNYTQAGGHPFIGMSETALTKKRALVPHPSTPYAPIGQVKQVVVEVPPGVVGNALAVPVLCPDIGVLVGNECPDGSVVGGIRIVLRETTVNVPIYAIEPEFGTPAQFGFVDPTAGTYTFSPRLRPEDGYAIDFELAPAPQVDVLEATVTLCDFGGVKSGSSFTACKEKGEPGANPKPLFTNPTRCGVPLVTRARLNSWQDPTFVEAPPFANAEITGCEAVDFEPEIELEPTSRQADSPTGLDVELSMPTAGLEDPNGIAQANLKGAKITFPEGMAVNASAGQGLGACGAEQVKLKTNDPIECPDSSKIGSVEIETPVIADTLEGNVYIARQGEVDGSLIGLYLVFDSPENGILVKIPATVDADQKTGQLVVTVDDSPEQPFSAVRMHFPGGPRATLLTPPKCGTYEIKAELTPWSAVDPDNPTPAETVVDISTFEVDSGPNGGQCPNDALEPKLSAGTVDATAGKASPFVLQLSRDDGTQRFSALNVHTPRGLAAYLKGIPYCPQAAIDSISAAAGTGQAQIAGPSCPAASQIGTAIAGAGAGPDPLFVDTGRAYLAGPYKGAPLSIVLVAPAVAGPLDLGNVVVRTAIRINPETAEISAVSDSVPTILHGILLDVRDIRVALDRPNFTLNPTNCEAMAVGVDVKGENGANVSVSDRFQAKNCGALKFRPKLSLRLIGGTKRGDNPKLRTVVTAAEGEANIGRAAVTIPRSEFLDQSHIRTICTRVQFAADACPKGSVYGHATATTPLLDYPVKGPVYLRSSNNKLPDLVVALQGPDYQPIEAVVVGRIDSIKGQIRATIEGAPDVPVSKFVLTQQGGKKGLLINSRDICASKNRATVKLTGQNGKTHNFRPLVKNSRCNKQRKGKRKKHARQQRSAQRHLGGAR